MHAILLGDDRFTKIGCREQGVFIDERDHNHEPLPEFIGARQDDLPYLMKSLNIFQGFVSVFEDVDPVIQATILDFAFVYIHPLKDGKGKLHRYLIHHVLAERKFSPEGMVFPVSSVMLDRIENIIKNAYETYNSLGFNERN